ILRSARPSWRPGRELGARFVGLGTCGYGPAQGSLGSKRSPLWRRRRARNPPGRTPALVYPPTRVISTNQFRNGNHIEVDGTVFKILEFQHVKPGKGGAFVRTKLRRASDGNVIDRTFRAGEKFRSVRTEVRRMQYLYRDGADAHFMDSGSYEQLVIPEATISDALRGIKDSDEVELLYFD